MSYCTHYKAEGAWPCTLGEVEMPDRMVEGMSTFLRALSVTESAIRAHEQGATADQLAEYLLEIHTTLMAWGGEHDAAPESPAGTTETPLAGGDPDPADQDPATPPRLPEGEDGERLA